MAERIFFYHSNFSLVHSELKLRTLITLHPHQAESG